MRSQEVLRMIKVVRFMSFSEFLGLIEGKELENARWFLPENEGNGFWSMEWENPVEITDKVNKKRREKNA